MFHGNKPGGMLEKAAATPERQNLLQQKLETNKNKLVDYKPEGRPAKLEGLAQFTAEKLEKNRSLLVDYKTPEVSAAKASGVFFGKRLKEKMPGELTEQEAKELRPIYRDFVKAFRENMDKPDSGWVEKLLEKYLPGTPKEDIRRMNKEITETIHKNDVARKGSDKLEKMGSAVNAIHAGEYLQNIQDAINQANKNMSSTVLRKDGMINQNPNLDGFIAERYHTETFNVDAAVKKSKWRAEVKVPEGAYGKNSVDASVYDGNGLNDVRRYQFKYGSDAKATERMKNEGNYKQRLLTPEGQSKDIRGKATEFLESPDGKVHSTPLSKERAKEMQRNAQNGELDKNNLSFKENVAMKDLAPELAKDSVISFLTGAVYGAGKEVVSKLIRGEKIEGKQVTETALKDGGDFAAKQALAALLKVGSEKDILKAIPKETSMEMLTNVSYVVIEDAKIAVKVGKGELTAAEGAGQAVETTASTGAGIIVASKGAAIGGDIGSSAGLLVGMMCGLPVLEVAGGVVGEVVGGSIGYLVGSGAAESFVKGAKEMLNNLTESTAPQVVTV